MADIRRLEWVVHRIGEVACENGIEAPTDHLFNGKGTPEDAHIGMNAHEDNVLNTFVVE